VNTGQTSSIDRRDFVDFGPASAPFTKKNAGIVVGDPELFEDRLHVNGG
jgi:hypothetical protein